MKTLLREKEDDKILGLASTWTRVQDIMLLEAVEKFGPHNWGEVARLVQLKTGSGNWSAKQLEEYFHSHLLKYEAPPAASSYTYYQVSPQPSTSLNCNELPLLSPLYQPPRPPPAPPSLAHAARHLAGYNPARGDFATPLDPQIELLLVGLLRPESRLEEELLCTRVEIYNHHLKRRNQKLSLLCEHGLLTRRTLLPAPWQRFSSSYCALDLAYLVQGIEAEHQLRARVLRLQQLRRCGVTLLASAPLFKSLEKRRGEHASALMEEERGRKGLMPLDIVGLPDYEKLSEPERVLCTELRLLPSVFAQLRAKLEEASLSKGGLLLAEAREALRIDVNKTRKVFDLLVTEGVIQARLQ